MNSLFDGFGFKAHTFEWVRLVRFLLRDGMGVSLAWGWHGLTPTILSIQSKSTRSMRSTVKRALRVEGFEFGAGGSQFREL